MVILKTYKDLKPVLMNPKSKGLKEPYFIIKGDHQIVFILAPGLNGEEFNKTIGYFSSYPTVQNFQVALGQGIMLMQRNDELGEAKEFKFVNLHAGRQVAVPSGWGVCLINTSKSFLIVQRSDLISDKYKTMEPIVQKQGFAYYVIEKKGDISFERNPHYHNHPQITTE